MSFKSARCWLLPTKSKSNITLDRGKLELINKPQIGSLINSIVEGICLYITINERPKVGDWYIVLLNGGIPALEQVKNINDNVWVNKELFETTRHIDNCFKIIASTDNLLSLECDCGYIKKVNTGLCSGCGRFTNIPLMPTPSSSFIKKYIEMYNKNTPIESCMIEYEQPFPGNPSIFDTLKVNSNNEITIKRCKESNHI